MKDAYVVVDRDGRFWNGAGWSAEYPEAVIYPSFASADAAARKAKGPLARDVVRSYGTDKEDCIRSHPAVA